MNKYNKEKVKSHICQTCGRPPHKKSKYCIFHAKANEKGEEEFKKDLKKYIEKIKENDLDYNFYGFIFVGNTNFVKEFKVYTFKNADFGCAIFNGKANFEDSSFKGEVDFNRAIFEGNAEFSHTDFEHNTDFKNTTFNSDAHFEDTTFQSNVDFREATFIGDVSFWSVKFNGDASFLDAIFEGNINFSMPTLSQRKILSLKVKNKGIISFKNTYLENIDLNLNLDKGVLIDFENARLRNTQLRKIEINGHILQERDKDFSKARKIYLLLKNNFHSIGRYDNESWAFKKEKDMERKSYFHFKSLHKWLWSCFLNVLSGYSERPGNVINSAIIIILIFTFLFMSSGVSNTNIGGSTLKNFLDCICFSLITFSPLGTGNFSSLEGWSRKLAATEALIGVFMIIIFVYTFSRRTGGR